MYKPPNVEITQIQETTNVNAVVSALMTGVIGPAYKVVGLDENSYDFVVPVGSGFEVTLKGIDYATTLDVNSVYVDFISEVGERIPFSGELVIDNNDPTAPKAVFTLGSKTLAQVFPRAGNATKNKYKPRISFRALYTQRDREYVVTSVDDLTSSVGGNTSTLNPLGFAASLVLKNSPASFSLYPIKGLTADDFKDAFDNLESSDMYAVSVLSQDKVDVFGYAKTWVNDRSTPENSRPTQLFFSPSITWVVDGAESADSTLELTLPEGYASVNTTFEFPVHKLSKTDRKLTAEGIAYFAGQIADKRVTLVHPDMSWVQETRHVGQLSPAYVENVSGVSGGKAVLMDTVTLADGTRYVPGTIVSSEIYGKLALPGNLSTFAAIRVMVPVPGWAEATKQAALVSALNPSDPKTQIPTSGTYKVEFSDNYFGYDNLNIIAGGGVTIIVQPTLSSLPASRHHLSTDMTTIESRENNILHQIDVTTINYKKILATLTGRYKQNSKYFSLLAATLRAYAESLMLQEYIKDLKIIEVKQVITAPDRVKVVARALPFYAANYIDMELIY